MSQVHSVTYVPVHSLPLAAFAVAVVFAFQVIRVGVAGRNRPAEVGGGRRRAAGVREERAPPYDWLLSGLSKQCVENAVREE